MPDAVKDFEALSKRFPGSISEAIKWEGGLPDLQKQNIATFMQKYAENLLKWESSLEQGTIKSIREQLDGYKAILGENK